MRGVSAAIWMTRGGVMFSVVRRSYGWGLVDGTMVGVKGFAGSLIGICLGGRV